MAKNYSPKKYGARIWCEHFRGLLPDSAFQAYGDVLELQVEKDGDETYLTACVDPTPELVKMSKDRQKVFWSIEMDTNFAKTGEAYLTGLAVTDTPASLGTEIAKFSIQQNPAHLESKLFSEGLEADWQLDEAQTEDQPTPQPGEKDNLSSRITAMLFGNDKKDAGKFKDIEKAVELTAATVGNLDTRLTDGLDAKADADAVTALHDQFKGLEQRLSDLTANLSNQRQGDPRPPAGGENAMKTDC